MKTIRILSALLSGITFILILILVNAKDPLERKCEEVRSQLVELEARIPGDMRVTYCTDLMVKAEMCLRRSNACKTRLRAQTRDTFFNKGNALLENGRLNQMREELRTQADSLLEEILFHLQVHVQKA